jgi:RHS repeat-associated protein
LLEKVANGLNHLSTIAYTKLSQAGASVYQQGAAPDFPVYNYQGGLPVVTTLTLDNGAGSSNSLSYYYEGAKIHRQGKGFLCYSKITATDATAGLVNETISGFGATYYYPQVDSVTRKTTGGVTIETNTNNWTQKVFDAPSKLIFPYVNSSTATNSITGFSVITTTSYDDRGNPSYVVKNYSNGVTETSETIYDNAIKPVGWLAEVVSHSTITYAKSGETPVSKTIRYSYSTDGVTKPDIVYYYEGTQLAYTKNNDYDTNGNLTQTVTSGTSIGSSQVNFTYETNGIRVLTATDALGHVTTNTYDSYGRLYTMTDYLSNANTYGYDALGRQSSVSSTNGSQITTAYVWSGTNKPALGVFGVTQTGNDGSVGTAWYDKLGRAIRSEKKGFGGTMILTDSEYNAKGQVYRVSDPYFAGGSATWAETYSYDGYGRNDGVTRNTGRNTTYAYSTNRVTETTAGKTTWKETDCMGLVTTSHDNGGDIAYTYYPDGKVKNITAPGSAVTTMQYDDAARNQTQMVDPSAGTSNYTYDSFGRVKTQVDARSQTTTFTYLADGRTDNVVNPEGTATYSYNTNKQLTGISNPTTNVSRTYSYDSKGRVTSIGENIVGSNFSTSFTYDNIGRLSTRTHPSAVVETLGYNGNGYLATISAGGSTRYTLTGMNAREQLTGATYGNTSPLLATYGFDTYGYPSSTSAGTVQDYRYSFDAVTGNLNSRQNFKLSLTESCSYTDNLDNLDRLTSVTGPQNLTMTYAANGNILTKSDISSSTAFTYGASAGPYSLTGATSSTGVIPTTSQAATYNSFEKVSTLTEGNNTATFVYNADNQRAKMTVNQSGSAILIRWYAGGSYMKETAGSVTKEYTYLGGDAYTAPVAAITQDGTTTYYYLLRDYLGNITHQVNTGNTVVAEFSFDAWGRRRNPADWSYTITGQPELFADRGFTGHEYLKYFNLYNMNGRMYDPLVGRFLNADPVVQDATNSQSMNKYSYCLNNPLRYTDPSGYRMAAADEYRNLGIEVTNFDRFYGFSPNGDNGGGGDGGWGGNGGVLPGWYTPASNLGQQLYNTANGLLGSIAEDEVYSLTDIGYSNGAFEFAFGRNEIATQYYNEIANYIMSQRLASASNIGYGASFDGEGDPQRGNTFPNFSTLWKNYPAPNANGNPAHPSSDRYPNQCAIRLGVCLQLSGVDMSKYNTGPVTSEGYPRGSKSLADWLWQQYGYPTKVSQPEFRSNYWNQTGIIYIAPPPGGTGHIDLFNQGATKSGYYFGSEIWFWNIK